MDAAPSHLLIWQQTIYYLLAYWLLGLGPDCSQPGSLARTLFLLSFIVVVLVIYATFILYSFLTVATFAWAAVLLLLLLLPLTLMLLLLLCFI